MVVDGCSQAAGLVPIVEPEILIDGPHDAQTFADVSERVIQRCGPGTELGLAHGCGLRRTCMQPV